MRLRLVRPLLRLQQKTILAASRIAKGLAGRDIAVVFFDFTGIDSSEGEFANTHLSSNIRDRVAAAD
jgi:alpha/beta superfamily hydrolase